MGIAEDLSLLDRKLAELKVQYELYFSGAEKTAPLPLRAEVEALVRRWNGEQIPNTMHKFRYHSLVGRYSSLSGLWNRCVREIEEGTFKRDLFRLELHEQERREREARRAKFLARVGAGGAVQKEGPAPPRSNNIDDLYRELLEARAACGQEAKNITREGLARTLETQSAQIRKRYHCTDVAFKVKVENGKVKLVATPVASGEKL